MTMRAESLAYWLQGFFEISCSAPGTPMTGEQVDMLKKHLHMVFRHEIDPSFGADQADLNEIHNGEEPQPPATYCFKNNRITLEQLFGIVPMVVPEAVKKFRDYLEDEVRKADEKDDDEDSPVVRRPALPRSFGGDDWSTRKIMC